MVRLMSNTIIMNIIICGVYLRVAFIPLDVALWGGVYSRAAFIRVNTVYNYFCCKDTAFIFNVSFILNHNILWEAI